jgi:hypothetical protein
MRAEVKPEFVHTFSKVFWDIWSQVSVVRTFGPSGSVI